MAGQDKQGISKAEMDASAKRAARLQEISEELESGQDSEMAKILAEINARNKKH